MLEKRKLFRDILIEYAVLTKEQLTALENETQSAQKSPKESLSKLLIEKGYCTKESISEILTHHWQGIKIGDLLVQLDLLTQDALDKILAEQITTGQLGERLINDGLINESDFIEVLSKQLGIPRMCPLIELVDTGFLNKFSEKFLRSNYVLPLFQLNGDVTCIMANPLDLELINTLESICAGAKISAAISSKDSILSSLDKIYSDPARAGSYKSDIGLKKESKSPISIISTEETVTKGSNIVQTLMDYFIRDAMAMDASDVYFESSQSNFIIGYRVDGILFNKVALPLHIAPIVISHIKAISGLDITEKRLPQDGKLIFKVMGREIDLRIATYPSEFGENLTVRILDRQRVLVTLQKLGLNQGHLNTYHQVLHYPAGLVLVTGPTGSGKTTTLYSSLNYLKNKDKRMITIEDPIEYTMPGVIQASYRPEIGVDYETVLKAMMRQTPDVIMVGEIRDRPAAEATIQAALTGHKVFSTFHTEDTIGALLRLMDMGIETFLISSTVVCIVAQRLVRQTCEYCREPYLPEPATLTSFGIKQIGKYKYYRSRGCAHCRDTGYKGRVGIFEVLVINDNIRDAVLQRKTSRQIREIVQNNVNMLSMIEDGFYKAYKGITTLEEVLRVCYNINVKSDSISQKTADEIIKLCEGNNVRGS